MRSATVMTCLLMLRLRGSLAAVEPFGKHHALLIVVAQRLIEGMDLGVIFPDHQLKFLNTASAEPVVRRGHDHATVAFVAMIGIDRDVIDPAAMAIMTNQRRRHEAA